MRIRKKRPELNTSKLGKESFFPNMQKNFAFNKADAGADTQLVKEEKATTNTNIKRDRIQAKIKKTTFFAPRFSNGFQTVCDVNIHPDDKTEYLLKQDVRHVGTGLPKVKTLSAGKGLKASSPCIYEATMAHEQVHIDNAQANCKGFKKCLDDEVNNNFLFDTNSSKEYDDCYKKHHGGLAKDCKKDEQEAYTKTVQIAKELLTKPKCESEKSSLETNIKEWKKHAINPPNC